MRCQGVPGRSAARKRCAADPGSLQIQNFVPPRISAAPLAALVLGRIRDHAKKKGGPAKEPAFYPGTVIPKSQRGEANS
jgi:hypothetical protein